MPVGPKGLEPHFVHPAGHYGVAAFFCLSWISLFLFVCCKARKISGIIIYQLPSSSPSSKHQHDAARHAEHAEQGGSACHPQGWCGPSAREQAGEQENATALSKLQLPPADLTWSWFAQAGRRSVVVRAEAETQVDVEKIVKDLSEKARWAWIGVWRGLRSGADMRMTRDSPNAQQHRKPVDFVICVRAVPPWGCEHASGECSASSHQQPASVVSAATELRPASGQATEYGDGRSHGSVCRTCTCMAWFAVWTSPAQLPF